MQIINLEQPSFGKKKNHNKLKKNPRRRRLRRRPRRPLLRPSCSTVRNPSACGATRLSCRSRSTRCVTSTPCSTPPCPSITLGCRPSTMRPRPQEAQRPRTPLHTIALMDNPLCPWRTACLRACPILHTLLQPQQVYLSPCTYRPASRQRQPASTPSRTTCGSS